MEVFTNIVTGWKPLTIFVKIFILGYVTRFRIHCLYREIYNNTTCCCCKHCNSLLYILLLYVVVKNIQFLLPQKGVKYKAMNLFRLYATIKLPLEVKMLSQVRRGWKKVIDACFFDYSFPNVNCVSSVQE